MENAVVNQFFNFTVSVIWGGMLGLFYECLGVLRIRERVWLCAIGDILFWTVTTAATFIFLLIVNGGEPEAYMLFGMAAGGAIIRLTLGSVLHRIRLKAEIALRRRRRARTAIEVRKRTDITNERNAEHLSEDLKRKTILTKGKRTRRTGRSADAHSKYREHPAHITVPVSEKS